MGVNVVDDEFGTDEEEAFARHKKVGGAGALCAKLTDVAGVTTAGDERLERILEEFGETLEDCPI